MDCENCTAKEFCQSCYEKEQERIRRFNKSIHDFYAKKEQPQQINTNLNKDVNHAISISKSKQKNVYR